MGTYSFRDSLPNEHHVNQTGHSQEKPQYLFVVTTKLPF